MKRKKRYKVAFFDDHHGLARTFEETMLKRKAISVVIVQKIHGTELFDLLKLCGGCIPKNSHALGWYTLT